MTKAERNERIDRIVEVIDNAKTDLIHVVYEMESVRITRSEIKKLDTILGKLEYLEWSVHQCKR